MSENDFIQFLTDKANILKKHLKDTQSSLVMCANIRQNRAIFKLYNTLEEDSLKLQCTITNLGNLKEQLYQLWVQLNYFNMEILSPLSNHVNIKLFIEDIYIKKYVI